jgi:hypothetical protein
MARANNTTMRKRQRAQTTTHVNSDARHARTTRQARNL